MVSIGVAAHITAAAPGGPRFDPSLNAEERQSLQNAIWLCQNCAKLIDNDTTRFAVEVLRQWKAQAEAFAIAEIEGRGEPKPVDQSTEIELTYAKRGIEAERHDYRLDVILANVGTEPFGDCHIDLEMPARVIHNPHAHRCYLPNRSNRDVAFFRIDFREKRRPIYPGDKTVVMSVEYYVDRDIFNNDVLKRPVRATVYRDGVEPLSIEHEFRDLQIF